MSLMMMMIRNSWFSLPTTLSTKVIHKFGRVRLSDGSWQYAGDVNHKSGRRLPLLSTRPAVTPATLKRVVTDFAAW